MQSHFMYSPDAATASAFTDTTRGGADSVKVNKFVPADESTIVVAMNEFASGIDNFSNYSYIGGVPHNDDPKTLREASDIKFIVLHETSGSDSGNGFVMPYTAHFVVLGDGGIQQFNDLAEIEFHEAKFNNAGIGIEFANQDWDAGNGLKKDSDTSQKLKDNDDYLWAWWGDGYNIYKIPPADRMERLAALVTRLSTSGEDGFISVDRNWCQLVSYNDVKDIYTFRDDQVPADADNKCLFIFSNGIGYITPQQHSSGIVSHNSVSNLVDVKTDAGTKTVVDENAHSDGSFQSLYTWLRIAKSMSQDDAYAKAKELLRNSMLVATTQPYEGWVRDKSGNWNAYSASQRRNIHLVDVSGV